MTWQSNYYSSSPAVLGWSERRPGGGAGRGAAGRDMAPRVAVLTLGAVARPRPAASPGPATATPSVRAGASHHPATTAAAATTCRHPSPRLSPGHSWTLVISVKGSLITPSNSANIDSSSPPHNTPEYHLDIENILSTSKNICSPLVSVRVTLDVLGGVRGRCLRVFLLVRNPTWHSLLPSSPDLSSASVASWPPPLLRAVPFLSPVNIFLNT